MAILWVYLPRYCRTPRGFIEGRFAIDDPLLVVELSSEDFKSPWILEMMDTAGEDKLFILKTLPEMSQELAPEQCRHDSYGNEEPLAAGDPAVV